MITYDIGRRFSSLPNPYESYLCYVRRSPAFQAGFFVSGRLWRVGFGFRL